MRDTLFIGKNFHMKKDLVEIKKNGTGTGLLIEHDGYVSMDSTSHNKKLMESIGEGGWRVPHPFVVDAVFQKYGIKNANGRIYPEEVLRKQVDVYMEKIHDNRAYGELNHPAESTIDLGRISHNIIELHWEGHTLVGKMVLNTTEGFRKHGIATSCGDMAANLLMNGYKIGVSSRGVGSVEQKMGQYIVGDDFELICWDVVSDPSTPSAYISTEGPEGLQTYIESKVGDSEKPILAEKISKLKKILLN